MNRFIDQKRNRNLGLKGLDGRLACWSSARQIRTLLRTGTTFRNPFNPTFHVPSTLGQYQHHRCGGSGLYSFSSLSLITQSGTGASSTPSTAACDTALFPDGVNLINNANSLIGRGTPTARRLPFIQNYRVGEFIKEEEHLHDHQGSGDKRSGRGNVIGPPLNKL